MGKLDESLDAEFPVWRIVLEGYSLEEIDTWSYEDIRKCNDLLDMRSDYETAVNAWQERDQ